MTTDKELSDALTVIRSALNESRAKRMKQESTKKDTTIKAANDTIHDARPYIKTMEAGIDAERYEKNKTIDENNIVIGNLRNINIRQHEHIDELKTTINRLDATYDSMFSTMIHVQHGLDVDLKVCGQDVEGLEAELSARKDDSKVLMQVAKAVDTWHRCMIPTSLTGCTDLIKVLDDVLEDYLNVSEEAREHTVLTIQTPSIGTRIVHKDEEAHTIDEQTMKAVRMLLDCDGMWGLYTEEEAVEVVQHKTTIDELKYITRSQDEVVVKLTEAVKERDTTIEELTQYVGQNDVVIIQRNLALLGKDTEIKQLHTVIDEVKQDLDARNKLIKDFKAIETKETDRLRKIIRITDEELQELSQLYCDACDKLERIGKISNPPGYSGSLDEITKIIQEE